MTAFHPVTPSPRHPVTSSLRRRITFAGKCWLTIALGLWGTGLYKGINLITLLASLMLAMWVVNFILAGRWLRRLRVKRGVEEPVFAHVPFRLEMEVENPLALARIGVRLEDRGTEHALTWFMA